LKILIPLLSILLVLSILFTTESLGDSKNCKAGLEPLLKVTTKTQVCVKQSSALILIERGWGIVPEQVISDTEEEYNPKIIPDDFISDINNEFFTLIPGTTFIYESQSDGVLEHNEVSVTNNTKVVLGIQTIVVWDKVWLEGDLVEETFDWYAQDKSGNVWYFGEDSKEIESGRTISTKGSWEAGVNGAKPGIIMQGEQKLGKAYKQEFYKGNAEDMAQIVSLNEKVNVPFGTFDNCIKTKEWNSLESGSTEFKFYCREIGFMALELDEEGLNPVNLVDIKK